eukprot:4662091-Pleurochrysis_carterae.AAC.1
MRYGEIKFIALCRAAMHAEREENQENERDLRKVGKMQSTLLKNYSIRGEDMSSTEIPTGEARAGQ